MAEASKVRLVRCPECENLLPEVTDYSIYQCGGCGAVLRASDKRVDLDTLSEKSEEERVGIIKDSLPDKYDKTNFSEKRMMGLNGGYESDRMSKISASSRAERRFFRERAENYGNSLMDREEMWDNGGDTIRGLTSDELRRAIVAQEFEDLSLYNGNENRRERSGRVVNGRNGERSENEGYLRPQRMDSEGMRYKDSIFSEEGGLSSRLSRPSHGYDFHMKKFDGMQDQLSQSGNLSDKGKEKVFLDGRMAHQDTYSSLENWYPERHTGMNSSSPKYSYHDAQFNMPPYPNKYFDNSSLMRSQELGGNGFHHPLYPSGRVKEYGDPLRLQILRRGPFQTPAPFIKPPPHPYVSGSYRDDGMVYLDPREPYHPNFNRHHPSCLCFRCSNPRHVPPPIKPDVFSDRFSDVSVDAMYNYQENSFSFGPRDYNSRTTKAPPLSSHSPLSDTRWFGDVNSEVDGFIRRRPPRVQLDSAGLHCHPIAGGSPFILCYNCFELLLLPKSGPTKSDSGRKVKCGACATVFVLAFANKRLVVCFDVEETDNTVKVDDVGNLSPTRGGHVNQDRDTLASYDYDNIGCDFQSMDREKLEQPSSVQERANNSSEMKHGYSMSTHTIDMEEDTESNTESNEESNTESEVESVNVPREDSNVAEQEAKKKEASPPGGSSLQELFEYSNKFHVMNHQREQTTSVNSNHNNHKKSLPNKGAARQVSFNDSTSATETDLSSTDFSATGTSFDSRDASRKGRRPGSFFAGIMKKSFKELNKSNHHVEQEKANVTVNGHLIPQEMIKNAEKVSGPISPGSYWYDYATGFWGVMGGHCLGMIPPYIEEFNYPMPEKCAGGNTDVFVNGRELNQKDMNLLQRRGLPADRNRSYCIETSGRIIDKDTGEELKSLGKLAPTVERIQRGFGMRVPKTAP